MRCCRLLDVRFSGSTPGRNVLWCFEGKLSRRGLVGKPLSEVDWQLPRWGADVKRHHYSEPSQGRSVDPNEDRVARFGDGPALSTSSPPLLTKTQASCAPSPTFGPHGVTGTRSSRRRRRMSSGCGHDESDVRERQNEWNIDWAMGQSLYFRELAG